ncbi:hypothetical protein KEF85_08345 [Methylomonas paludis]|uniref:Uncharacterized protein n=1 Tax=Methylomonas paludis TaxID=1173101 RepID=A0A975R8P6_9GAMM|nr:hypothetical protein [Methylomonas paludis]QWF69394.1 hypothetical protein KEF85_08345 [Methylomonas paludis]
MSVCYRTYLNACEHIRIMCDVPAEKTGTLETLRLVLMTENNHYFSLALHIRGDPGW